MGAAIRPRGNQRNLECGERRIVAEVAVAAHGVPLRHPPRHDFLFDRPRPGPSLLVRRERHLPWPFGRVASDAARIDDARDVGFPRDPRRDAIVGADVGKAERETDREDRASG